MAKPEECIQEDTQKLRETGDVQKQRLSYINKIFNYKKFNLINNKN